MDWTAVWLTFRLAAATALILLVLGLPLGYWLATTRWRGRFAAEAVVALPIVLPPTVLGFYLLLALGPNGPVGRAVHAVAGVSLPFTFSAILIGSVLFNLPFAVRPFTAAFAAVDRKLVEDLASLRFLEDATNVLLIGPGKYCAMTLLRFRSDIAAAMALLMFAISSASQASAPT